jgi:hypothetical protein
LYFELANLAETTGRAALDPPRRIPPPPDRPFRPREEFELHSVTSGVPAAHVLGQVDFFTGLRDTASARQMGKEISGLAFDRDRRWLLVAEKLNHRVLVVDVSKGVETFMPALAVLGQDDFDHNRPYLGQSGWHPRGMSAPGGIAYDHVTKMLFVTSGEGRDREILGFDLSRTPTPGMEPRMRIGGPHATVECDVPRVEPLLAVDENNRWLWNGLFALDTSGNMHKGIPLVGWFGLGDHPAASKDQDTHSGNLPSLLGYSVGVCHRFGGAVNAMTVNPRTGTVYVADNPRYRVLCFQPRFTFRAATVNATNGRPAFDITGSGGLAPLKFAVVSGKLPAGLELDPQTGIVRGTPRDKPGDYRVEVEVATATETNRGTLNVQLRPGE